MSATLKCPHGSADSKLVLLPTSRIISGGKLKANIGDAKPFVNILPFGTCKSMANPTVAAATAAAQGVLQQMPCTPVCAMWIGGKTNALAGTLPALMSNDRVMCTFGAGMITISDSGQGVGAPAITIPPLFPLFAALLYFDALLNIIKGIQKIESWEQALVILKQVAMTVAQLAAGALFNKLMGSGKLQKLLQKVPPQVMSKLSKAIGIGMKAVGIGMQALSLAKTGLQAANQLNQLKQMSESSDKEQCEEYARRGYTEKEAQNQISGTSEKCNPAVRDALGAYTGGGRK